MKLAYVHISGFRGYQKPVRIDFAESFTIIDGRNGVGKSTIFDAVEFALTGTISKYLDAKADRESVEDYLWWSGEGDPASERFVEAAFRDGDEIIAIRRTPLDVDTFDLSTLAAKLFDRDFAPKNAMAQLCTSTIIRDEHIARLSLDLKEVDRFTLLRDAIGAVDADDWIKRAQSLAAAASLRVKSAVADVEQANIAVTLSVRQIDQARSALPASSLVSQAANRLQSTLRTTAPPDQLAEVARRRLAEIATALDQSHSLLASFADHEATSQALPGLTKAADDAAVVAAAAQVEATARTADVGAAPVSSALSRQAQDLERLVSLGRQIGPRDGHCPLCDTNIGHDAFTHGLEIALTVARQLDDQAVEQSTRERARDEAAARLASAQTAVTAAVRERAAAASAIAGFDERLKAAGMAGATPQSIRDRITANEAERQSITADLRLLDTISLNQVISRATEDQSVARERVSRAEARLGKARLGETRAKAIFDAARRSAAETLDQRLERVLPLMSELYRRLRPHPVWSDIEYSVRGDVKRFLKLQVGGTINPQFVFSSGQRRATGLAFLLSVNLSIAWSRWRSILLDDPVQHVDDFRTVHLAEVLAHLCQSGRQIICAVEDSALADLMCRRLPTSESAPGTRIKLGNDSDGALSVTCAQTIAPMTRRTLVSPPASLTA